GEAGTAVPRFAGNIDRKIVFGQHLELPAVPTAGYTVGHGAGAVGSVERSPLFTQRAELSGALADRGRGNGTAEAGGRRTRALAEGEDVEVGERQRANQVERGAGIGVRLPREPGDHVRPETADGERLRQACEPRPVTPGRL